MKTFAVFILWLVMISLTGCSTSPVASAKKAGIKTVHLEPRIDSSQAMRFGAELSGAGGVGNIIGSTIVDRLGKKGIERMGAIMQAHQILVPDMIRAHAAARLQQYPELQWTEGESDGVFVIKIIQYGFDTPELEISRKIPFFVLQAELLNHQGERIWGQQTTVLQIDSSGLGATWEQYEANPEKLRADWNQQAEKIVSKLFPTGK